MLGCAKSLVALDEEAARCRPAGDSRGAGRDSEPWPLGSARLMRVGLLCGQWL